MVVAAGGHEKTYGGLAGLGNLLVRATASSDRSDDYQLGVQLARGETPGRVTEGARAAVGAARLASRLGVRTPILDAVRAVVHDRVSVKQAAARLVETASDEE
jgi:glycerol-3-phosphate dehydrogenase (NAD(P)+)